MNKNVNRLFEDSINVISMSGGKDSTAQLLLALHWGVKNIYCVFADTGHEHKITYEYLDYLRDRLSIEIHVVRANFDNQITHKREVVRSKWVSDGAVTEAEAEAICKLLVPTGNPFLDLCLWKGRFPSTKARFCSSELKHIPIDKFIREKTKQGVVISWQGVRADESNSRANLPKWERGENNTLIFRPILNWNASKVFDRHDRSKVNPNPLYKLGMGRVGCMPCIHAKKSELSAIADRFEEEISRVAAWEKIVSLVSKRGNSTFFHASTDPTIATKDNDQISYESHGIHKIIEWSKTSRGGRQTQIVFYPTSQCSSMYGLCE